MTREIKACAVLAALMIPLLLGSESSAANDDGIKLYSDGLYQEACRAFELNKAATWRAPGSAYYYALTLNALGKTDNAREVCKKILRCFPRSEAAKQSKIAIQRWSHANRSLTKLPAKFSDIGVVGLKFIVAQGHDPEIGIVFPGTPAEVAGLLKGDAIIAVDEIPTKDLTKDEIFQLIVGPPDTMVRISILRKQKVYNKAIKRMRLKDLAKARPDIGKDYLESGVTEP